ncbi:MAG TPA: hypothetical protein VHO29_09260 [Marmoricola sp.]|nr:hypothetical protein [Marmoricola sp.]
MAGTTSTGSPGTHGIVAWLAVALASAASVLVVVALSGHGLGGAAAVLSATALVLAIAARARHDRWILLWLPLLLFPALLATAPFWV